MRVASTTGGPPRSSTSGTARAWPRTPPTPSASVQGPPRLETLPDAVWINGPGKSTGQDAPGTTIVTPADPQHGVIEASEPIAGGRS